MIGDGVCDEITNTPRCLYDGGDCCQAEKSSLCRICTCKKDIDTGALQVRLDQEEVMTASNSDLFDEVIVKSVDISVDDVINSNTCSQLCLERSLATVNGWRYSFDSKLCSCVLVISTHCLISNLSLTPLLLDDTFRPITNFAIATARTLPCGKDSQCCFLCIF